MTGCSSGAFHCSKGCSYRLRGSLLALPALHRLPPGCMGTGQPADRRGQPAGWTAGSSSRARLQHQPASSRATAGCASARWARTRLGRRGRRWCQADSTSSRRAWPLPGLGDRALGAPAAGGVLGGHQPEVGADSGAGEPAPVGHLDTQPERGRDPPPAAQPAHRAGELRVIGHLDDRFVETVAAGAHRVDRVQGLVVGQLDPAAFETMLAQPLLVARRSTRCGPRPGPGAAAASRAGAGRASGPRGRLRGPGPGRGRLPRPRWAPAPRATHRCAAAGPAARRRGGRS